MFPKMSMLSIFISVNVRVESFSHNECAFLNIVMETSHLHSLFVFQL